MSELQGALLYTSGNGALERKLDLVKTPPGWDRRAVETECLHAKAGCESCLGSINIP